jgi:hypothetical protein
MEDTDTHKIPLDGATCPARHENDLVEANCQKEGRHWVSCRSSCVFTFLMLSNSKQISGDAFRDEFTFSSRITVGCGVMQTC